MSSKRAIRRRACKSKVRHANHEDAQLAISKMHRSKGYCGFMIAYACQFCGGFHVGHPNQRARQALRARGRI